MRKRECMEDDIYVTPQKYLDMSLEEIRARRQKLEARLKRFTKPHKRTLPLTFEKI